MNPAQAGPAICTESSECPDAPLTVTCHVPH